MTHDELMKNFLNYQFKHVRLVQDNMLLFVHDTQSVILKSYLMLQLLRHDLTKFTNDNIEGGAHEAELIRQKKECGNRFFKYPTKHMELLVKDANSRHIETSMHHLNYWRIKAEENGKKTVEIPYEYLIEMVCDWQAMADQSGEGTLEEFWNEHFLPTNRKHFDDETVSLINGIIERLEVLKRGKTTVLDENFCKSSLKNLKPSGVNYIMNDSTRGLDFPK